MFVLGKNCGVVRHNAPRKQRPRDFNPLSGHFRVLFRKLQLPLQTNVNFRHIRSTGNSTHSVNRILPQKLFYNALKVLEIQKARFLRG